MNLKLPVDQIKKIAVFRALQIGDMLCAIPAIRALHNAYPSAEITLIGLPWAKILVERFDYIHSLIVFPGYPGFPEQVVNKTAFPDILKNIQEQAFDLVVQMQGSGIISNPLTNLFAGKNIAGYFTTGNYCPDKNLFIQYPQGIHEIERHLKLITSLGIDEVSTDLEFPILPEDQEDFAKAGLPVEPGKYVIVHPGARGASRHWGVENFAAVADFCFENGLQVIITGTKEEAEITSGVINAMKHEAIDATDRTSLGAVAVLIKNAATLVSNCTGVSHIAAALKTKSIVISLDEEPYRWAPLNKTLHTTIDWATTPDIELVKQEINTLLFAG
ncbi:MAG TPA: glycosyltransferase family 9 protein [Segetibacter sp.]